MADIRADVTPESGLVPIAHDLYLAIARQRFTALERGVLDAVMYFTYGAGKSRAEISTEDIRYLLGAGDSLRTDRLSEAITRLLGRKILYRQGLVNGKQLLAVQKDYRLWTDKMSPTLQEVSLISNTVTTLCKVPDKMSATTPPERLLAYAQLKSKFKYGVTAWRIERKYAKQIYIEALEKAKDGEAAYLLICDYIDDLTAQDWIQANVKFLFTYMSSRFEVWRSQIPRKPREVGDRERASGMRYRYNVTNKQWIPARDKGGFDGSVRDTVLSDGSAGRVGRL